MTTAFAIRTVAADGSAYGGFKWPLEVGAVVAAPDWSPEATCGKGLHGLLDGVGSYSPLSDDYDAVWQIVEVDREECVDVGGDKVKFPRCKIVYSGGMAGALTRISAEWVRIALAHSATTGNYAHSATTGYRAHSATTGEGAHSATTGEKTIAASLGEYGRAKAGEGGAVIVGYWDKENERPRVVVGYVGENGIKAHTWYEAKNGELVESED